MADLLEIPWVRTIGALGVLLTAVLLLHLVARRYVLALLGAIAKRTRVEWDQEIFEHRVPHRATLLVPLLALEMGLQLVPGLPVGVEILLHRVIAATLVLIVAMVASAMLSVVHTLYLRVPAAATRPIKSYIQVAQVAVYIVAAVFIIARLADQSPWYFVSGLGAMMAIITLIFRDTLLSLVAGVQLTNNDLVRVGDWIEMPQFGADGDVVDIALHTVKVENWDKTITVIPTHKFLDHSFRNWRGMFEGGGRRIKRAIHINTATIRFLTDEELDRLARFALLRDYIAEKRKVLAEYNGRFAHDPAAIVNARRLTNIGTFRAYVVAYLKSRPDIRQDMTFLVRQLSPTPEGLPIELYVFTNDTRWSHYEGIQADVFDHILSVVSEFGLQVYQRPSSHDLGAVGRGNGAASSHERARGMAAAAAEERTAMSVESSAT